MNQDSKSPFYTTKDQKPNSRPSSAVMNDSNPETIKRRRFVAAIKTPPINNMFRPTAMQSALLQKQLSGFLTSSASPSNSTQKIHQSSVSESSSVSGSQSPPLIKSESPTPIQSMTNLHIEEEPKEKTRHDLFLEQMRIREENKKRQQETILRVQALNKLKVQEQQRVKEEYSVKAEEVRIKKQKEQLTLNRFGTLQPAIKLERPQIAKQPTTAAAVEIDGSPTKTRPESDDDLMVDEEMTNRNVCIGMIKTDIVVEKAPLILIRDEQYEIVSLESEGKLNTDNYSFKVTSRSLPARFYGWVPFKDTKVLGPLVDHQMIWWDAVIPRGKATNTRTPLCIILYTRPDSLGTIAKYFESQRLYLKTPPFYNPVCRYSNPHHHIIEQQQQQQLEQQQQQQLQQYQSNYAGYQNPQRYNNNNNQYSRDDRQEQKDIEMLLASIPSDVPQILLKKKKKKQNRLNSNVIEILDDDEEEEEDKSMEEDKEEEGLEDGYVEGLDCHLMDHQIKGVSWMIDRENNLSSNGGILADDMGLGKTIQTIALMASTMTSSTDEDSRITLIITPLALIHQWVDEIITKTEPNKLRVLKHHGPNRTKDPKIFNNYDVIVTTYQVVAGDMPNTNKKPRKKKKKVDNFIEDDDATEEEEEETSPFLLKYTPLKKDHGPLFQVKWYRIVLDEAQFIKNRTTKASTSCATLLSVKRWCLTGTPIQNNVDELYSLLRFLRIQPLSEYATFKKTISIPIMNGDVAIAMSRLKAVLMAVMLRRTKSVLNNNTTTKDLNGDEIKKEETKQELDSEENSLSKRLTLQLPTREKTDILLEFSDHEKALYNLLSNKTKDTIQSMVGTQGTYMNMLCLLLRLRQACDHPQLILNSIDNDKDVLGIVSDVNNTNWSPQKDNICELCGRSNNESVALYCNECMSIIKNSGSNNNTSELFKTSTKIRKVIEILKTTRETNPGEKTIIFSQFTSMLNLMEEPLKRNGFKVCRYDGSMSTQLRERSLSTLKYDSKCTVMLISLKCGSLGLNLTAANRVILVDIWWNPALEEQAIDRVHRIGQKLPVHVTRLLIDNTVELKIIKLQEKKAQLSKGALGDGLVKNAKLTASEIKSLFDL